MDERKHYFVFDEGMGEVARAVADDQPDKSGLQQLLLWAQSCEHLIQQYSDFSFVSEANPQFLWEICEIYWS